MRKEATLSEGHYFRRYTSRETFLPQQPVRVVGPRNKLNNEDDEWIVATLTGELGSREFIVEGHYLSPHPEDRETNVEFVQRLMEFSPAGALMQAFVLTAIEKYAQLVQQMPQDQRDQMDRGFIAYGAWENCANKALEALKTR